MVTGIRPKKNWPLRAEGIVGCDLEDLAAVKRLVKEKGARTILSCGGSCALKSCELDPAMAELVNIHTINSILDAIEGSDIHLVHLSIDLVFSGNEPVGTGPVIGGGGPGSAGGYVETDWPDPVTVYGATMVKAEQLILERRPQSCILRISLPMGVSFNGHAGAIDWIQSRFAADRPATLFFDEVRTPTYVDCLNEVFEEVIARRLSGIYHAGGPRPLSLYEIAQIVNRVGGYDPQFLKGCPRIEAGPIPPRAGNVSLNSQKLIETLGRDPFVSWPLLDEHLPTDTNWHFERNQFEGSKTLLMSHLYRRPIGTR